MEEKAARVMKGTIYAAIATSSKSGGPWNSPVYVTYDENLTFYWASSTTSQHSQNINTNPQIFITIYNSEVPWGEGEGVFIQATAREVDNLEEVGKACQLRKARVQDANQPPEDFMGDRPRRIYCAKPTKVWVNQDSSVNGFFIDTRAEVDLTILRTLFTPTVAAAK